MVIMKLSPTIGRSFLTWSLLATLGFVVSAAANENDKAAFCPADYVINDLELRFDDAVSAESLARKRFQTFERLIQKGSASAQELRTAKANLDFASDARRSAEALLTFLKEAPRAEVDSLADSEMYLALPGLSVQVGLIGFGHLRVINKEATLLETEKLIRFDRSNPGSLETVATLRDFRGSDQAKLADVYSTDSEKRMSEASLAALNRKVDDIAARTTESSLLGDSRLTLTDMLMDQNSANGAGYLATLYSWSATTDAAELAATRDLCHIFAESTAEIDFAEAVVALAEITAEAKQTLLQRGSGSPLEVRIAEAKLGIAKAELERARENHEIWKTKESLVMGLSEAPLGDPEVIQMPSTIQGAIASFEALSESIDLNDNSRLAQSGYSILKSQFDAMLALARSEEARKMSAWRLATLEKNEASELEMRRASLTLAKDEAYKAYRETVCRGLTAKLSQLSAIGRAIQSAEEQGKSRDNFALPHSESLASSLARLHELHSNAAGATAREMEIAKFYEWKHSELLGLKDRDQESLEVHRVGQMMEESRLIRQEIDESQVLATRRAAIADGMFDALVGKQAPLSAGDLPAAVRESLFDYHTVQLNQNSAIQLAQLNLAIEREKLARMKEVGSKGMASSRELNGAEVREKLASIQVANSERRKEEIIGLSQQMAAAFGVADASMTSTATEE